jgi:subtilisin family serine protease
MLVVNSAGNRGGSGWNIVSAPADADSVLAVGAVNAEGFVAGFSSRGPTSDGRVKPNVMAQGVATIFTDLEWGVESGNGTSFSGPVLAGMAACLWHAFPEASAWQVNQAIEASAHLFQMPNDSMGFGIPDFEVARAILGTVSVDQLSDRAVELLELYPNPYLGGAAYLTLSSMHPDRLQLQVFDMQGRPLESAVVMAAAPRIEVSRYFESLPAGVYLVTLHADGYRAIARIVVL